MISELKLIWKELSIEHSPNSSHYEYLINDVNLKDIIDVKYGYNSFIEQNQFIGWINEGLDLKGLELSEQILKGDKINDSLLTDDQRSTYEFQSQIPIYTCQCGDINCNGIIVDIIISENKITWNFNDKVISPMVFDLRKYREEIDLKMKELKKKKY